MTLPQIVLAATVVITLLVWAYYVRDPYDPNF